MDGEFAHTVKCVMRDGRQAIYPARNIHYCPKGTRKMADGEPNAGPVVIFEVPNGCTISLGGGRVYVMNSNGRTVGDYVLGDEDIPEITGGPKSAVA